MAVKATDLVEDRGDYCRRVEAYLCQKNQGHLIRIVGPAFDAVCSWADRGVPLAIVCQGIDRCVERHNAKGARRRPVQIQFCEADVLDLFDDWRRTIGIGADEAAADADNRSVNDGAKHGSLPEHLERVIARLTMLRGGAVLDHALIDRIVRELDIVRASAKGLRGRAREDVLDRLRRLDAELISQVRLGCRPDELAELRRQAEEELAPFKERLPADAYEQAAGACVERLLRVNTRLPRVAFD
jgi:hypothetical protein